MDQGKIDRINELAWKHRTEGLTPEETAERAALRAEYSEAVKRSLESHLERAYVEDDKGNLVKLKRKNS